MKRYIIEFIGTYFLVLSVGMTVNLGEFAPLVIGLNLTALVYFGGHISLAHYNPAVTLAMWMRHKIDVFDAIIYVFAQLIAAILAALTSWYLIGKNYGVPAISEEATLGQALLVEVILTFILVSVILQVALHPKVQGNQFYGIAIGLCVVGIAYMGGSISGGAYNPAVGLGGNIVNQTFENIWVYLIAPLIGGSLAAVVYKVISEE